MDYVMNLKVASELWAMVVRVSAIFRKRYRRAGRDASRMGLLRWNPSRSEAVSGRMHVS
jgi:hypothetical protein